MSLIKVMQALVNLQADTCERCVDAMAPPNAKNERGRLQKQAYSCYAETAARNGEAS
jgi:hypothetical protein